MTEKKVTHCPKCQKPTMNGGQFMGAAQFKIKCPWCQAVLRITVQPKITAEIITGVEAQNLNDSYDPFEHQPLPDEMFESTQGTQHSADQSTAIPKSGMKVTGYLYPDKQ